MHWNSLLCLVFSFIILATSCNSEAKIDSNSINPILKKAQDIKFEDKQNFIIHGNLYKPEGIEKTGSKRAAIILLPMLSKTKETYNPIIPKLVENGYVVFAIDLKGHGKSIYKIDNSKESFNNFNIKEWKTLPDDANKAINYLSNLNYVDKNKIAIIGASIGANTAIISSAEHPDNIKAVIALSPGLDFKGLIPNLYIQKSKAKIFLIGAKDDKYSAESVEKLFKSSKQGNKYLNFPNGGHGTNLFKTQPDIINMIIDYLNKNMPAKQP